MIDSIKLRLGIDGTDEDELLFDYIGDVTEDVLELLNMYALPKKAESIVKDLVVIKYNKNGSEGLSSESYGGVSQHFEDDIPKGTMKKIKKT